MPSADGGPAGENVLHRCIRLRKCLQKNYGPRCEVQIKFYWTNSTHYRVKNYELKLQHVTYVLTIQTLIASKLETVNLDYSHTLDQLVWVRGDHRDDYAGLTQ